MMSPGATEPSNSLPKDQHTTNHAQTFMEESKSREEHSTQQQDSSIVSWDGPEDPANPKNRTGARKWTIIGIAGAMTFISSLAPTMFAPGIPAGQDEFNNHNSSLSTLLVSIFVVGIAIGPVCLTPLGELYGRLIIMHVANVIFFISCIISAVAVDIPMLIVMRLATGLASSVPATVGGGIIADLIEQEKRGSAMAFWVAGPLVGPAIGPIAGGYLTLKAGWRWTFWLLVILSGIMTVACFLFLRETSAARILELKARRLRKETRNENRKSELDRGTTSKAAFRDATFRQLKMLIRSPIVMIVSLYVSIVYSYMYLLFATFTDVFQGQYGFNTGEVGLAYLGLGVGFVTALITLNLTSDRYLVRQKAKYGHAKPEDRLPPLIVGSFLVPVGLFWYGWTAQYRVHWIVPIIGTSFTGGGTIFIFLPVNMYLVDAFTDYAASAIGASVIIRSIFGTCIPIAAPAMYRKLGYSWGNSLLGFIALAFSPVAFLLLRYGEAVRKNPKFQPSL